MTKIILPGKGLAAVISGDRLRPIPDNRVVFDVADGHKGMTVRYAFVDRSGQCAQIGEAFANNGHENVINLRDFAPCSMVLLQIAYHETVLANQMIYLSERPMA